ncbi:MAG: hypothetical protein ACK4TA_05175 [Saprospiraceae bacterium]
MKRLSIIIIFFYIIFNIQAQDTIPESDTIISLDSPELFTDNTSSKLQVSGYLKSLQTLLFFNNAYPDLQQFALVDTFLQDNLIHNRLNIRYAITDKWNFRVDVRSRIFFGDLVKANPNYADAVDDVNNDYFDLSLILLNKNSFVIHTMLDRLYLEYVNEKWEVRIGRQRINWGISGVWNPNDIFNAFAFTDFDYEERPGSDAIRIKYNMGFASSVEIAMKAFDTWSEATAAAMWKFNTKGYDFQLLTGIAQNDWVIGGGWAGNVKDAGFKGEVTYFFPIDAGESSFAATFGLDYSFSNSLYTNVGYLYNSNGETKGDITGLFNFNLSAKNLYPYRHAIFTQVSYPFTPLLNGGAALIYSPVKSHALFINPTLTYSLAQNWDLDLVGQLVFNKAATFTSPIQAVFLRMKWSY